MTDINQSRATEFLNGILIHDALTGIFSGTADPTAAGGTSTPLGSLYLQQGTNGAVWVKYDSADTDWRLIDGFSLSDADGDTKIQVEESADEDIIRFDAAGTQMMEISSSQVLMGSANDFIIDPDVADGASAVAYTFDTKNNILTAGAKIASFKVGFIEKARIGSDGSFQCDGHIGMSGANPNSQTVCNIAHILDPSTTETGVRLTQTITLTSPGSFHTYGMWSIQTNNSDSNNTGSNRAFVAQTLLQGDSTLTTQYGLQVICGVGSSSTTGVVSAVRAIDITPQVNSGTITNAYGVIISEMFGTNDSYGIYQSSTNDTNYFAGNTSIGSTSNSQMLDVAGDLGLGASNDCVMDPDVVDGASAIAYTFDTKNTLSNSTAKLLSFKNNASEKFSVTFDGGTRIYGRCRISTAGSLGTTDRFVVTENDDYGAGTYTGIRATVDDASTTTNSHHLVGFWLDMDGNMGTGVANTGTMRGVYAAPQLRAAGDITSIYGIHVEAGGGTGGTGTVSTNMGIFVQNKNTSATITNSYGIYITAANGSTGSWGIYQAEAADDNYFKGSVGFGDTAPNSGVEINTSLALNFNTVAVNTLTSGQTVMGVLTGSGTFTVTLATVDTVEGRIVIIKDQGNNAGTNNITIATEGAQTIDGAATLVINANYGYAKLYCDGSNWFDIT